MPKLKTLSGEEVIKIFSDFGFVIVGQKGSHVKLKRMLNAADNKKKLPRKKRCFFTGRFLTGFEMESLANVSTSGTFLAGRRPSRHSSLS